MFDDGGVVPQPLLPAREGLLLDLRILVVLEYDGAFPLPPLVWSELTTDRTQYLTHHYLIDLVAGGSLAVICFYYFLPDEFRHLRPSATPRTNSIPLDEESGKMNSNGHADGYGGWEEEDDEASGGLMRDPSVDIEGRSGMV